MEPKDNAPFVTRLMQSLGYLGEFDIDDGSDEDDEDQGPIDI